MEVSKNYSEQENKNETQGNNSISAEEKKKEDFKRTWEMAKQKHGYYKPKLYNRKEAHKLLGFKKSKELTDWLTDNGFMDYYNYPNNYFLERNLMGKSFKYITPYSSKYDDEEHGYGKYDDTGASLTKTFCVPLFTQQGIAFFLELLKNPLELEKIV
ncbi:MAG: hypothetical protein ABI208_09135, partial [Ginsengibacter sp.]